MCGIAGIFNLNQEPVSTKLLENMAHAIRHRGPDGEGIYTDNFLGLAHRRLAIIDLSPAGHQPMMSHDKRYVISYNGEVYNFRELRVELEAHGHQFKSNSDTEVVLNAFLQWGEKSVEQLNGMFAFAIWDKELKRLFLARDRYGIKPLYYTVENNSFIFASEIKGVLQHPAAKKHINKEALIEYFTFQNLFTDKTLFANIKLFPAGSYLTISAEHSNIKPVCYWDYNFSEPSQPLSHHEYVEEIDRLFQQAVNRQLVSDVDVGSYLSGGIDSGAITAVASQQLPWMRTFTCGFDMHSASGLELSFDEREKAEYMSYLFKTEHYEMVLKAGDMERIMPHFAYHLEEPRVGQSYPNFYISQLASKFVKVALAGTGGDELFGGYPWRYYRAVNNDSFEHYIDKYYLYWQRLIPNKEIHGIFAPIKNDVDNVWTRDIFRDVFTSGRGDLQTPEDYVNHSLYFEAKTFLHGLLVVEDKLSMAHSLETRVPFLDNDLVDFAMQVPVNYKLGKLAEVSRINENTPGHKIEQYFNKTRDGKLILRKVLENHVPQKITKEIKQGFSAPDATWFQGESMEYIQNRILNNNAAIYNFMDYNRVSNLVMEHLQGKVNRRLLIWSLLNVEECIQAFNLST